MWKNGRPVRSEHHLIPRSRGGNGHDGNLRELSEKRHAAWHLLFGNKLPEEVIAEMIRQWVPPDYFKEVILIRSASANCFDQPKPGLLYGITLAAEVGAETSGLPKGSVKSYLRHLRRRHVVTRHVPPKTRVHSHG